MDEHQELIKQLRDEVLYLRCVMSVLCVELQSELKAADAKVALPLEAIRKAEPAEATVVEDTVMVIEPKGAICEGSDGSSTSDPAA